MAVLASAPHDPSRAADCQDSCTFRDRTSQGRAFVSGDQPLAQFCAITDGQGLTHQCFGALLQPCAVFDAAGSDNGCLDQATGVIFERVLRAGADRFKKTLLTQRGI